MKKIPTIIAGDTWTRAWLLKTAAGAALDLTGATARLHLRDEAGALRLEASTANGLLTITQTAGRIDLVVPPSAIEPPPSPGRYRFGLEITFGNGQVCTVEQATLVIVEDVTHG